jgi:hypothetical protein
LEPGREDLEKRIAGREAESSSIHARKTIIAYGENCNEKKCLYAGLSDV